MSIFAQDPTAKKHKGNKNSNRAHQAVLPHKDKDRRRILQYLNTQPKGATRHEVAEALGLLWQTATARIAELKNKDIIYENGGKPSPSGCRAALLFVKRGPK